MKKQITLSVLLLLMLAQLASCGSEGSPNDITTLDGT